MKGKKEKIHPEDQARDRILKAASRLFYAKGYPNTGINEVLEEASAFKKSLYTHFPSKKDLGKAYLLDQEEEILGFAKKMMLREKDYSRFIVAWLKVVKRALKRSYIFGCPYANLSNQTHDEPELAGFVKAALKRWVSEFETYLSREAYWKGGIKIAPAEAKELSESILFFYQGAMQLYGMSGDLKYMDRLQKELLALENRI